MRSVQKGKNPKTGKLLGGQNGRCDGEDITNQRQGPPSDRHRFSVVWINAARSEIHRKSNGKLRQQEPVLAG